MKKLARSAGLPAPLPAEASTTEDPPTATTESPRPGMSLRPDPATQGTTRQTTDLDLTSFMASFHPGLASEPRPAAEARGVAAPAAPSSNVLDEMQRLREKPQALRSRVAGTTPAVLMAIFSGRLGSRGLTIPHFREEGEQAALEAGPSNGNFASNFSPSAVLPTAATSCDSYDDILDGIDGLARVGEAMLHNHMLVLTERLRVFVSKNKSADPGCLPARVKLVLLFVNKWLGPALEHVQVDNPAWWTGFSQDVEAIDYKSPEWTMSLVITLSQAAAARPPDSRDQHQNRDGQGRREKSVPDDIRQLIPTNRRGEEPCLRFLGWVMCLGGTRDRCGHHKRIHGWPSADIPRCLKDWAQDTYARRRGWDQVHNQDRRGTRS
ncbi:hypothetical protein PF006_g28585 [Phytophthora fragariae]|uniref:Uncharacterized protein n=1 Tax=Phytophthora fragariae TaxID=53985 RepID=A0A6A3QDJ8_9STRA|nr:hypothetical protein PF006_g28585 [Phytophthora fragariae]